MIVFTASSLLPQGFGTQTPLEDKLVLSEKEVAKAEAAVSSYNTAISELATTYNIALVDTYSEMKKLASESGIRYYGNTYTTTFVSGGASSTTTAESTTGTATESLATAESATSATAESTTTSSTSSSCAFSPQDTAPNDKAATATNAKNFFIFLNLID